MSDAWNPEGYAVGPFRERGARDISNCIVLWQSWSDYEQERNTSGGRGRCMRCAAINTKPMHTTEWMNHNAFVLCEECWQALTPEQRVPFYTMLWAVWVGQSPQDIDKYISEWPAMCAAVLAGG